MTRSSATILHVDMDAFFASVELVRRPELRGLPVVVGGSGPRGVVAAASYEARVFGIHSAMASSQARRLCPDVVFLPGDHDHYGVISRRIMDIFRRFTPLVEPLSLDEAFLDVDGGVRLHGPPVEQAAEIRRIVAEEESLACSVGVAPNKFLAKLASDRAKPRIGARGPEAGPGTVVVEAGDVGAFLYPLPVTAVWGVGPSTAERLRRLGVRTVGDLAQLPEATLVSALGQAVGRQLWRLARGIDDRAVEPEQVTKSIGHEETFAEDRFETSDLYQQMARMVDAVAGRLRRAGVAGRTVHVKMRTADFVTTTRARTLPDPTDTGAEILEVARVLLDDLDTRPGVRLLGVSLSGLEDASVRQLRIDDLDGSRWRAAEGAVDEIRDRFGGDSIGPGAAVGPGGLRPKKRGDQQWGPDER